MDGQPKRECAWGGRSVSSALAAYSSTPRGRPSCHVACRLALVCLLTIAASNARAQQLTYTPVNPTFGGNPFNSSHLLAGANAQNQYKPAPAKAQTPAQLFAQQLQSRLLTALASQITDAIFGPNPQNSGTITFGDQTITFLRGLDSVNLTITDSQGVTTVITVPTFVTVR
nr:curli production assembly/transport component CsgF [Phenylobacterium sp.]